MLSRAFPSPCMSPTASSHTAPAGILLPLRPCRAKQSLPTCAYPGPPPAVSSLQTWNHLTLTMASCHLFTKSLPPWPISPRAPGLAPVFLLGRPTSSLYHWAPRGAHVGMEGTEKDQARVWGPELGGDDHDHLEETPGSQGQRQAEHWESSLWDFSGRHAFVRSRPLCQVIAVTHHEAVRRKWSVFACFGTLLHSVCVDI